MRNGAVRVLSLVAIAVWLCAAARGSGRARAGSRAISVVPANGMFDALQRDMLMMKDRLAVVLSADPAIAGDRSVSVAAPDKAV